MSKKKSAIIAGIAGQDGSYLAELLIGKGYRDEIYNFVSTRHPHRRFSVIPRIPRKPSAPPTIP